MTVTTTPAAAEPSIFGAERPDGDSYILRDLVHARRSGGRKAGGVMRDYLSICLREKRVVNPDHYFKFRLYELGDDERHRIHDFIDDHERRKLNVAINKHASGYATIDHKFFLECVLRDRGVACVETLAVLLNRRVAFGLAVYDEESLRARLADVPFPLFCKPVVGSLSRGVVVIERYDAEADRLTLAGGIEIPLASFFRQACARFGRHGYLLQRKLEPHAAMRAVSGGAIGSVRVATLSDGERTAPLYAMWKIPSVKAIADAPWRTGFTVAHVDVDNGEVLSCRIGSGTASRTIDEHPETGAAVVGFTLPCWEEVCRTAVEAAAVFYSTGVIGWDIAITVEGPRIVEGNANPDHGLLQMASGQGLYGTDAGRKLLDVRAAVERWTEERKREDRREKRKLRRERRERVLSEGFSREGIRREASDRDS